LINNDSLTARIVIGASILFAIDNTLRIPKQENSISGMDAIGPLWHAQNMDGFIASFHLNHVEQFNSPGTFSFSDGMYQEDNQKISAEIIMMMPRIKASM
jgi:hypothetical protein